MLNFLMRFFKLTVRENAKVRDNVKVILTDIHTGERQIVTSHNIANNHAFSAFASWIGGVNNTGYNPVSPPTQIQLGSGTGTPAISDTGLFATITGTLTTLSYVQTNAPTSGTTTFVFQIAAGVVTTQVTEAILRDTSGNIFAHTMFSTPFTPSSSQNVTIQWEYSFSA